MDHVPLSPGFADKLPSALTEAAADPASVPPEAAARYGRSLLDAGEPTLAFPLLLRALEAEPGLAERWLTIQEALIATSMFDAARKVIDQVQQLGFGPEVVEEMRQRLREAASASLTQVTPLTRPALPAAAPAAVAVAPASPKIAAKLRRARQVALAGRRMEAVAEYRAILKIAPDEPEAVSNLGELLAAMGRLEEAVALLHRGIATQPQAGSLPLSLARILIDAGRHAEAEEQCRAALALAPAAYHTNYVMGRLHLAKGENAPAERHFRTAVQADPEAAEALAQLGNVLQRLNRESEAEAAYRSAITLKGNRTDVHLKLCDLYNRWGVPAEAEAWLRKALVADPRNVQLWLTLNNVLFHTGQAEEALVSARSGLAAAPDEPVLQTSYLFTLLHLPGRSAAEVFAAHREFGQRAERQAKPFRHRPDAAAVARRPRLGLVSGDFGEHVVAVWFLPLWEKLRALGYEIHAYGTHDRDDHITERLRGLADGWRTIRGLSDDEAAKLIRDDGIDILIDLSGHTAHNRLKVFARKPAPVQVSYLGYPATTGLTRMDYYIACGMALPEGEFDDQFTEKLVRLPRAYMFDLDPFAVIGALPEVGPLPALTNGYMTFGSFNRISKSSQSVVDLWARVMHAVPNSRFLLAGMKNAEMIALMTARFAAAGIGEERLMFRRHSRSFMRFHNEVDLLLDSYPYGGGTTTNNALRMGVPVLSLAGDSYVTRAGIVLMGYAGLEGFIVDGAEEFVARAVHWSEHLEELAAIRARLPGQAVAAMRESDLAGRGFDAALLAMWRRFCEGQAPAAITITAEDLAETRGEIAA